MCFNKFLCCFYHSEAGFLLSTESLLLGTIGVLGSIVGLAEVRNAAVEELGDFSHAVAMLSQDYAYTSVESSNIATDLETSGSVYEDDGVLDDQAADGSAANGIIVLNPADTE
jgi:hypothetical protein